MKIIRIVYERGANLGDFESVRFTVETEIATEESTKDAYLKLKAFVDTAIKHEIKEHAKVRRNEKGARLE